MTTLKDELLSFNATKETPKTRFLVSLSDGRTVIQDDRVGQRHAWIRLREWLQANHDVHITGLRLQGARNFMIDMPSNCGGYFFGNKIHAVWGGRRSEYVGVGYLDKDTVRVAWYRVPNFDHSFSESRTVPEAGFLLIEKSK